MTATGSKLPRGNYRAWPSRLPRPRPHCALAQRWPRWPRLRACARRSAHTPRAGRLEGLERRHGAVRRAAVRRGRREAGGNAFLIPHSQTSVDIDCARALRRRVKPIFNLHITYTYYYYHVTVYIMLFRNNGSTVVKSCRTSVVTRTY